MICVNFIFHSGIYYLAWIISLGIISVEVVDGVNNSYIIIEPVYGSRFSYAYYSTV